MFERPGPCPLAPARVHEVGGPGAAAFAAIQAATRAGSLVWIQPAHVPETLLPAALAHFHSPERLLLVIAPNETDLLWATEEALRSGAADFVVAAPEKPLTLLGGRRLQLAAEAGRTTGLMLIREGQGSPTAETRWHAAPVWDARDSTLLRWSLIKNKRGTFGDWTVRWDDAAHSVTVVSSAGERPLAQTAPP
jgi:protein ImuA